MSLVDVIHTYVNAVLHCGKASRSPLPVEAAGLCVEMPLPAGARRSRLPEKGNDR